MDKKEKDKEKEKLGKRITKIGVKILGFMLIAAMILVAAIHNVLGSDMAAISEENETYSVEVQEDGTLVYYQIRIDENGEVVEDESGEPVRDEVSVEEIAGNFEEILASYINAETEEEYMQIVTYLIQAETVTTTPYIDRENNEEGEELENSINGAVKFYRFDKETNIEEGQSVGEGQVEEENRLTFVSAEEFEGLKEQFITSGDRTVFNHFTMGESGSIRVAYGYEEKRSITTNGDADLTEDIVREESGWEHYAGNYSDGFYGVERRINEKPIDYASLIEQYIMPTNFLYALLVQTRDINFVQDIARLAYESEIAIGIYDNENETITSSTYNYKKILEIPNTEVNLGFDGLYNLNPARTTPPFSDEMLSGIHGTKIPYRCYGTFKRDEQKHSIRYKNTEFVGGGEDLNTKIYIKSMNSNGITGLETEDAAKNFVTTYVQNILDQSAPTAGVVLADTWIAKWTATYTREVQENSTENRSGEDEIIEDKYPETYNGIDEFINAFDGELKNSIAEQLNSHANGLKQEAVNAIIEHIEEGRISVNYDSVYEGDAAAQGQILLNHIDNCEECRNVIDEKEIDGSEIYSINATRGTIVLHQELRNTIVQEHYNQALREEENRRQAAARQELIDIVRQEGTITYTQTIEAEKNDIDISFETTTYTARTTYKKSETVLREDDGKKFSEVYNKPEYNEATDAIIARKAWFFEYIEMNEDTKNLESIIKYLLNIATNSNDFGTFTEDDIENLFGAFEPEEEIMRSASIAGKALLRQYIDSWENQPLMNYLMGKSGYVGKVVDSITEDKAYYKVTTDGTTPPNPTVGFGIDLFHGAYYDEVRQCQVGFATVLMEDYGYSLEELQDTSGNTLIPVEIIDELKEKRIEQDYNRVLNLNETYELNLTNYQIYALTSRLYNCGNLNGFVEAYTSYYNFETDDRYGEEADFENRLYINYMSTPITASGEIRDGLINRRKSEWILFQTGYMNRIDRWCSTGGSGDILDACVTVMNELLEANIHYSLTNLPPVIDIDSFNGYGCCCATYVSRVLYISGALSAEEINEIGYGIHSSGADCNSGVEVYLSKAGWTKVSESEAAPGDVCIWHQINGGGTGHVFIYAGENEVWEQSSGVIGSGGPTYGTNSNWNYYSNRYELCIYRMP